ncbi:lipocalin-like domain-containing protein [Shewanella sp. TC10]|uniref:lipocalin-like domain-containing protein n=1 Tax=Shewanella sp. TC10 TaxID=1419739 RepID=UPI00129D9C97|nr:lipocalin-like domain-containing protein [Shewanella sp. TC10]
MKRTVNHLWLVLLALIAVGACQQPESTSPLSMGGLLGEPSSQLDDYDSVTSGYQFSFPDDHLSHDNFRQEWWYLTANMQTQSGEKLGIQWTQFRIALAANNSQQNTEHNSDWATSQMYMSHAAITSKSHHLAAEKWSRGHPNLADVSADPFTVKLDNWQWVSETTGLFPATLSVATDEFSYQLSLTSDAPMQLQGDKGFSIKSADAAVASYYYSQPFIELSGTITRNGKQELVTGKAWLDREWSSQFLTKAQQGWDWFSIRLDDGSALMVFQLRGADENTPAFYSARRMFADGSGRNISSAQSLDDISMTPLSWQQTDSGKYPTSWQLAITSEQIDVTINALNPDSNMPLSIPYWEGPISVIGSHSGDGYMELTGY